MGLVAVWLFISFCIGVPTVSASHFRYGTFSWRVTSANGLTVEFYLEQAYRTSYYTSVGFLVCEGSSCTIPVTDYCCCRFNECRLFFGDTESANIALIPSQVARDGQDWFVGTQTISHSFPSAGRYLVGFSQCCRLSSLRENNNDNRAALQFTVDLRPNMPKRGIRATMFPIVQFYEDRATSFLIPGQKSDNGADLTYIPSNLNSAPDSNVRGNLGSPTTGFQTTVGDSGLAKAMPTGLTLSQNGLLSWKPAVGSRGLYAMQVICSMLRD